MTEKEFLETYDSSRYEKPSVTADILIFTMNADHRLELLLIQRGGHPYLGKWAIPGGFVGMEESLEEAAMRELMEETGLSQIYLEQLYTFGKPERDPRMRVISVAYMALVPKEKLSILAGDDAKDAALFEIAWENGNLKLHSAERALCVEEDLAFDHLEMIRLGLNRLEGKLDYSDIAFELLEDKNCFTVYEMELIYEAISGKPVDKGNFRRDFRKKYILTGRVMPLQEKSSRYSRLPAACYQFIE